MLGTFSEKLQGILSGLMGKKTLSESNISDAVREVRLALLEADVNYSVAKRLIQRVKEKSIGDAVIKSVTPGQQFIKILHDELVALMGGEETLVDVKHSPAVFMMCGLQGSGKTTHCAKLARYLLKSKQVTKPLLAACDLQRPAAVAQLITLGEQIGVPVFSLPGETDPVKVARAALQKTKDDGHDLLIVDTAGRLHIDDALMSELSQIKAAIKPHEILFVANAATGQDAVNVAAAFNEKVEVTGTILTMLDSNMRGGAAISIREITGKPLKFEGIGEKVDDIQVFNPKSMADRILGMGDTINLVRRAKEHISEEQEKDLEQKIKTASFTYGDYLTHLQSFKKMGPLQSLIAMMPGMSQMMGNANLDEKEMFKVEAIILSMTPAEREERVELSIPRRKRIASGSGRSLDDINRLVKSFKQMKQFCKNMPNMKQMQKIMGGPSWQ